jgi:hypothetical protein
MKKGKDFESAKLLFTRGYLVLLPAKHQMVDKAASFAGAACCLPFFSSYHAKYLRMRPMT